MRLTRKGVALGLVILALVAAAVLFHDFIVEATLGVLLVIIAAEAVWVAFVVRTPEKRLRLVEDDLGQGGTKRIVLYPGDESVRHVRLVKKIGGRVDIESMVNFQRIAPRSVTGQAGVSQLELRFSTPYAGDYVGDKVRIRVAGSLGFFSSETTIPFDQKYVVYPRTVQIARATLRLLGRGELGETPIDMPGIGTEFYEMRGYQPSDDYRDVNWRASARMGDLVVVEHMREVGGSYLLVLDTRARGFADVDRLAAAFLSLANGLASSGVSFGVLAHDGEGVVTMSTGDSPRSSLGVALGAALSYTRLEPSPELFELSPQKPPEGYATGGGNDTTLSQLLQMKREEGRRLVEDVDPWAAILRYISERSIRNLLWVSDLNSDVGPLIELAWEARHHHDVELAVVDPCSTPTAEDEGPKAGLKSAGYRRALTSAGAQLYYGEPTVVAQRVLGA